MKKVIIFSLLIILITTLFGCSNKNEGSFKNNDETSKSSDNISSKTLKKKSQDKSDDSSKKEETKSNKKKEQSEDEELEEFYGKWHIKKVDWYGDKALENNSNNVVGKTIEFSKDNIVYDGKEYRKPSYTIEEVSDSDFFKAYNKKLSDFQIDSDSAEEVRVGNSNDIGIGNVYVWKNSDTLIMIKNGNCYELKKL